MLIDYLFMIFAVVLANLLIRIDHWSGFDPLQMKSSLFKELSDLLLHKLIHRLLNNLIRLGLLMFDKPNMFRELSSTHLSFSLHYASMMINWQVNISSSLHGSLIWAGSSTLSRDLKSELRSFSERVSLIFACIFNINWVQSELGIFNLSEYLQSAIGSSVWVKMFTLIFKLSLDLWSELGIFDLSLRSLIWAWYLWFELGIFDLSLGSVIWAWDL